MELDDIIALAAVIVGIALAPLLLVLWLIYEACVVVYRLVRQFIDSRRTF